MATNFPAALDSAGTTLPNPGANDDRNSPSLAGISDNEHSAIIAVETKVGIGSSNQTPANDQVLLGTGAGASEWGAITSAYLASITGSGAVVLASGATLTSPTINTPVISNPTLDVDTISGFTSANNGTLYGISISSSEFSAAALTDGSLVPSKLVTGTGSSWVWQSWTPTFTNFTQGNATISAVYIQMGKITFYQISIKLGSSSSMGTNPIFSLPTTAAGTYANVPSVTIGSGGMALAVNDAVILARAQLASSTSADIIYETGAENVSYTQYAPVEYGGPTSTIPFTWTTGSCIDLSGFYQNT